MIDQMPLDSKPARQQALPLHMCSLELPCFFPSISSVKTALAPLDYLEVLATTNHPLLLFSAYDVYHAPAEDLGGIRQLLADAVNSGKCVLLDSGNYESFWKRDQAWNPLRFGSILTSTLFQVAFCYDHQEFLPSANETAAKVEEAVLRDQTLLSRATILPIVHGSRAILPDACALVAGKLNPFLIAVPERELGEGILARAEAVIQIRHALNTTGHYYPLHLLGSGNPLSILIYSACGADSYDGLEWCQTVVDYPTARLYHFHQREMLHDQLGLFNEKDLGYIEATLAHNLQFYSDWLEEIRGAVAGKTLEHLLDKYLPASFVKNLSATIAMEK